MNKRLLGISALAVILGFNMACANTDVKDKEGNNTTTSVSIPGQPVDLTVAAEKAINSVVSIKVTINSKTQNIEYYDPFEDFFGDFFGRGNGGRRQYQQRTPKRQGSGSGVIISKDGYIVTNNHVVENADVIDVKLNDNREFKGRIIGTDKTTDLALIKVEGKELPAITIGNSDNLKLGEWVLAIGNPFGLNSTVTAGIVSAKARSLGATGGIESFIQTDAAINPGNSGGALVNVRGDLVGINAMIYSQTGSYAGYGFAIPTSIMNKVVADLKQYGTVQRAMLEISGTDVTNYIDQEAEKGNKVDLGTLTGVYVADAKEDGAAAKAGIQKGDVIISIDNKNISKFGEMQEVLVNHKPGDKVQVKYLRNKKEHTTTVTLRNEQGTTSIIESVDTDDMGVGLRELTASEKTELGLRNGLIVVAVRDGKMKDSGVTKDDIIIQVNDKMMSTKDDFEQAVREANMSTERVLWIRAQKKSGRRVSYAVELGSN
ncbi:MAG: Do family serine endopeptidase [Bacteroidaceae bacterium]|nr:Do family serine endopeptidase [Bacteroidaceae bacterium]